MSLKDLVEGYTKSSPARFHMPGHKGDLCSCDITELSFSDDLHNPCGAIADLQRRCADVYGAKSAYISVNGSSGGICAALTALALKLRRSPRILVTRDCHKSFFSGAYIANATVCGVYPAHEPFGTVRAETISEALDSLAEKPDCVFITSPNYYGMCADTKAIYDLVHSRGIYLFVDCAHGAHFPMSEHLPPLPCADVFVVSTHKTLGAYNQTGILLNSCDLDSELAFALDMLQTTSPSYPFMLSIEKALSEDWEQHLLNMSAEQCYINDHITKLIPVPESAAHHDITRLCIPARTGYTLGRELEKRGIYTEMSDINCTVLITTPHDRDEWYERLNSTLSELNCVGRDEYFVPSYAEHKFIYTDIRAALTEETELVPLQKSEGRVSARAAGIYPPGTAYIFPGERITAEALSALHGSVLCGGRMFGADTYIRCLTD